MRVGRLRRGRIFLGFKTKPRCRTGACWCQGQGHGPVWLWGYETPDGRWRTSYLRDGPRPRHLAHLPPEQRQALPQVRQLLRLLKQAEARAREALKVFKRLEHLEQRLQVGWLPRPRRKASKRQEG